MDYEKAYKDALERAKNIRYGNPNSATANVVCEEIFPELKESEDERIRKWILDLIENLGSPADEEVEKELEEMQPLAIAWLEKQGNVKFLEVSIEHGKYYYCIKDYYSGGKLKAKRGDVVQALRGMSIMILDSMEAGKYFLPVNKIENQGEQKQDPCEDCDHIMLNCGNFPCEEKKGYNVEQKSAWSEEDERMIEHICYALPKMAMGNIEILPSIAEEYAERLKSLKNRVQPHWKPTEEQLQTLKETVNYDAKCTRVDVLESLINDLKKL